MGPYTYKTADYALTWLKKNATMPFNGPSQTRIVDDDVQQRRYGSPKRR